MLGGNLTLVDSLIGNVLPTVFGNLVGGLSFARLVIYITHARTAPVREVV